LPIACENRDCAVEPQRQGPASWQAHPRTSRANANGRVKTYCAVGNTSMPRVLISSVCAHMKLWYGRLAAVAEGVSSVPYEKCEGAIGPSGREDCAVGPGRHAWPNSAVQAQCN
jgi:uncharacterized membrane protein